MQTLAFAGLSVNELLIVLAIVVILFGASKIPQMMKGMGQGIKEFKKGMKEDDETKKDDSAAKPDPTRTGGNGHPA
jgi:sec-independent protein translocase protein TatA